MKILIAGAGIGGLAAAIALARAGHAVTLAERASEWAPVGAGIVLAPNAARALQALGVEVSAHGRALPAAELVTARGARLQRLVPAEADPSYGPIWALARPALHEALRAALPASVEVLTGCAVSERSPARDVVEVALAGATRRFDLLIGADGLRSRIREQVHGAMPLRYSGVTCWRGLTGNPGFTEAIEAWGGAARIGLVPLPGDRLYYFLVLSAPPRAPTLRWPDGFTDAFGHLRGGVERLFETLTEAPPLHHDLEELEAPVWGQGRTWLLGDAAHAMTPNLGQGAAMAIEDALALTAALDLGFDGALARYQRSRHARVRRIQLASRRLGALAHWQSSLGCAVRDSLLRALPAALGRAQYRGVVEPGLALVRQAQARLAPAG